MLSMRKLIQFGTIIILLFWWGTLFAQQPQTTSPLSSVNAKYSQGVGMGYWPTKGSGLTLDIAAGTAFCSGRIAYAGGTLTMANNTTNYVYLDTASSCAPASNTSGFSTNIPIATVVTSGGVITTYTDDRTMFFQSGSGSGANTALSNLASVGINTSLLAQTGVDLGSTAKPFRNLFLFGSGTYGTTSIELTGSPTGARTFTMPDANTLSVQSFTCTNQFPRSLNGTTGVFTCASVANADLVNPSTTVNGQTCTLGSTCTIPGIASSADLQIFNLAQSGTNWTMPASAKLITVLGCGAGGGGGGGSGAAAGSARTGGGGGGGGFCSMRQFRAADITSPVTITVGTGGTLGTGTASGSGADAGVGGTSSFGSYIQWFGGGGGAGNSTGAAGGGGAGGTGAGTNATATAGVLGGPCILVSVAGTSFADCRGAGSSSTGAVGNAGTASYFGAGSGATTSSTGAAPSGAGGTSVWSGGGGGQGAGVNAATPGTAQNGTDGGGTGGEITATSGGGGTGGVTASACGSGGEGQVGTASANSLFPGGTGGGGGASKNGATGCVGGNGGVGGGGAGGGGGGTSTGGNGGTGGAGYVMIWSLF